MRRAIERYWFPVAVVLLLAGIVGVGSFLVTVAGPDLAKVALQAPPSPSPTVAPSPSPGSLMALSPIGISMPEGSDCNGCHVTDAGALGTREIPVMAHPLFGWRDCTACHKTGSLVASAPGHSGLHKDQCLVCHETRTESGDDSPAPLRPEHMGTDKPCVACHGVDEHAPLPDEMAGRDNCWICHNGAEFKYLFEETPTPSQDAAPDAAPGGATDELPAASPTPQAVSYRLEADAAP